MAVLPLCPMGGPPKVTHFRAPEVPSLRRDCEQTCHLVVAQLQTRGLAPGELPSTGLQRLQGGSLAQGQWFRGPAIGGPVLPTPSSSQTQGPAERGFMS